MKIHSLKVKELGPIKKFDVEELSGIVVIGGRNGIGKTKLMEGLVNFIQSPQSVPEITAIIHATSDDERREWGKDVIDTTQASDQKLFLRRLQKDRYRRNCDGVVLNFESDRSVKEVTANINIDIDDPDTQQIGWNITFGGLKGRVQDTVNSVFAKLIAFDRNISKKVTKARREGAESLDIRDVEDPTDEYKRIFSQLLGPKELIDIDVKKRQLYFRDHNGEFPTYSLSSGEREVLNIAFDIALRNPSNSIILFDEPELHLHPELTFRLLKTLSTIGSNNQYIFCTHSPDLITSSLDNTVVFLAPPTDAETNQAIRVTPDDSTNEALKMLGQDIGIISLGKKIVLIEGTESSLDKQTYGAILQNRFPDLVLVPGGGRSVLTSLHELQEKVLEKTLWGVDFFAVCDHDAFPPHLESPKTDRLYLLKKYHLENYFLDENIIAKAFTGIKAANDPLVDPRAVRELLRDIAKESVSYATALHTSARIRIKAGNVSIMPKGVNRVDFEQLLDLLNKQRESEANRVASTLTQSDMEKEAKEYHDKLIESLDNDTDLWKELIPGKQVISKLAHKGHFEIGDFKRIYIRAAETADPSPFKEIVDAFSEFSAVNSVPPQSLASAS